METSKIMTLKFFEKWWTINPQSIPKFIRNYLGN